jgi:NTE family protein
LRGTVADWNCRNVEFFIGEVGFNDLAPGRLKALSEVPTRFQLPENQVDMVIAAGRDALRANEVFRHFMASLGEAAPTSASDASGK